MQTHDNRRLFDLAQRNAQRLRLSELSRVSSVSVRELWEGKPLVFHPETPAGIANAYSRCAKIHQHTAVPPHSSVGHLRTSSRARAYAWLLAEIRALPSEEYFASFGGGSTLNFDSTSHWVPDLPVTRVTSAEVFAVLQARGQLPFEELALVSVSSTATVVLDSYLGFIPEEPNPDEIICELAAFRDDT